MKPKLFVFLGVVLGLSIGFVGGRIQTNRVLERQYSKFLMSQLRRSFAEFSHATDLLTDIHSGSTNEAIQTLERDLESNLLIIGPALEELSMSEYDRGHCINRIRWFRGYRSAYPRQGASEDQVPSDKQIAHILSLVETNR